MSAVLTLLIVAATLAAVAVGRVPWLRIDRATMVMLGSALLLATGVASLDQLLHAIDGDTMLLLWSMMVLNGWLYLSGFFGVVGQQVLRLARGPRTLLALVIAAAGLLSALFLNDTVVLLLTPLILDTTKDLKRNPVPYLLGLATAANVGSTATITGNPQNIIIASASGISYLDFARALVPVALLGLVVCWVVIVLSFRAEFQPTQFVVPLARRTRAVRPLLRKAALIVPLMLALFVAGVPVPLAAFVAACALLATRRLKPSRIWAIIDWPLLVFFAGLFMVTGSLSARGLDTRLFALLAPFARQGLVAFGLVAALLSNLLSNVPAVLLLRGLVSSFPDSHHAYLVLAASATMAGNFTLLGSVANLILAELALRWGVRLSFGAYLRVGVPITLLTLAITFVLV